MTHDILARLEEGIGPDGHMVYVESSNARKIVRVLRAAEAFERVMDGLETPDDIELVEFRAAVAELRGGGA